MFRPQDHSWLFASEELLLLWKQTLENRDRTLFILDFLVIQCFICSIVVICWLYWTL